jgi:hypothetical protein
MFEIDFKNGEFRVVNSVTGEIRYRTLSAQTAYTMKRLFSSFFIEEAEFEAWWKDLCSGKISDGVLTIYPAPYHLAAKHAWLQRATRDPKSFAHTG